jgi:hypothetical protein
MPRASPNSARGRHGLDRRGVIHVVSFELQRSANGSAAGKFPPHRGIESRSANPEGMT